MFGPKLTTVFASRWKAMWFAVMVCMTAYCSVPHEGDAPPEMDAATAAQLADLAGVEETVIKEPAVKTHGDPWAAEAAAPRPAPHQK